MRGSDVVNGQTHEWIEVVINYDSQIQSNQPPTASFPQTLIADAVPGQAYTLSVTASDPDGDTLAYDWDFGDDTYNILNNGTQTKTWATAGVYLVTCTVSDMKGGTATAEVWVNVGNVPFRAPENPAQTVAGLAYTYYEGTYNQLPIWNNQLPVEQGTVDTFSIAPRQRNSGYAFEYEGYVEIPTSDVYTFTMSSRDGSRLFIGDNLLISNDGLQSLASPVSGNIALNGGKHRIRVEMFNRDGNGVLDVQWSTLSMASTPIPSAALSQSDPALVTPPTVAITFPLTGSNTIVGSDMTITAEADSPSGIEKVAFFIGSSYLGEADTLPYSVEWSNLPVGTFFITAVAYDIQGNLSLAEPVLLNVVAPFQRDSIGINFVGTRLADELDASAQAGAFIMQPNWNSAVSSFSTGDWDGTVTGLKDNEGTASSAWTRYKSRDHSAHSPSGSNLVDNSTPNGRLMWTGLRVRHDYPGPVVEVHEIPFAAYDVYVYFDQNEGSGHDIIPTEYSLTPGGQSALPSIWGHNSLVAGDGVGDYPTYDTWVGFKESTAASASAPVEERLGNYVVFRNVSGSMFSVRAVNWGSALNAIQIVSTTENPSPPNIYAQPRSISLPETRTASFVARYIGYPEPSAEWFRVGHGSLGIFGDTLTIPDITPADTGDYYVVVTNSEGTETSTLATLTVTSPPSAAPTDLTVSALSTSELALGWTDNADDEDGFVLYRAASEAGPWSQIATFGENVTEYVDSNLPESTTFYYRVSSFNEKGESNPSNVAFAETLTSPRPVTFVLQPITVSAPIGGTATLTVVVDAYPVAELQWMKDGVEIEGADKDTFTVENAQLSDHGVYTVRAFNMNSEATSAPAMIVVTEPLPFAINPLYVINGGTVSENKGVFNMTRSGTDSFQGIVSNFQDIPLVAAGDYLELSFTVNSRTGSNSPRAYSFGFFKGPHVTGNAQTMVTDLWEGYLHQPPSRDGGTNQMGTARQGRGPIELMGHVTAPEPLNGPHVRFGSSGIKADTNTQVVVRLERINESQIRLTTVYPTGDQDRSGGGNATGITSSFSTVNGICTAISTFPAADGPEVLNGFAIATRANWVLQDFAIATNVDVEPPPPPPAAPTNLAATAISSTQIDLAWSDMSDPTDPSDPADGFRIERSANGSSNWSILDTVTDTSYSDTGLTGGSTWYYRVFATRGGISSSASAVVSATTPDALAAPVITSQPQSQTVGEGQDAILTVTATGNPAPEYQWRKGGVDLNGETADTLTLSNVTHSNAGDYTVFVSNGIGAGVGSAVATLTVTDPPPPAPSGLTATAVAYDQIDLAWSDPSDPTDGFRIERSDNGSTWSTLTTVPGTSHSDTGLTGGSTWHYRVIALRNGLESDPSNSASATTPTLAAPIIHVSRPLDGVAAIPSGVGLWIIASVELDPALSSVDLQWSQVSGQEGVSFTRPQEASTGAFFPADGSYVLRLTADDGLKTTTRDIAVEVGVLSGTPELVQAVTWGSSSNMRRRATSETDSTPISSLIPLSFNQSNLDLGIGEPGENDNRFGTVFSPYLSGLIDPEGANLSTRTFFWVGEQITVDDGPNAGNRRIGATSSYNTGSDWRGSAFEQYQVHAWHREDFLISDDFTLNDSEAMMSVNMNTFTGNETGTGLRFVVKNNGVWYYSQAAATTTGVFTLTNPGAAHWAVFNPEVLSSDLSTARTLAMPSNASFGTVVFDNVQYLGFATESLRSTNNDSRQGFDNFVVTVMTGGAANLGPLVDAGTLAAAVVGEPAALNGSASDDGEPAVPGELTTEWGLESGPGTAQFADAAALATTVTFDTAGPHTLRLVADDGAVATVDLVSVEVESGTTILPATVTLGDLTQTVDGTPRSPTVTTDPLGLAVSLSFNGSEIVPSTSNVYEVIATVTEPGYEGSATATFRILTDEGILDSTGNGADDEWEMATFGDLVDAPVNIGGVDYTRREVYVWGLADPHTQVYAMDGMSFPTVSNRRYQLQFRASLTAGEWQDVGDVVEGDGQGRQMQNPEPGFYRVRVMLP